MVKTRYTKADPNHMAEVGPIGPDGKEIPVSLAYGQVELAAKYSQQDCKLDRLLDGIEEEYAEPDCRSFVIADLFASSFGPYSPECVRIPSRLCKNRGMHGDQA